MNDKSKSFATLTGSPGTQADAKHIPRRIRARVFAKDPKRKPFDLFSVSLRNEKSRKGTSTLV